MSEFKFQELIVYQKSTDLANEIYDVTNHWPKEHIYTIIDQLRRASLSIALNIAEGSSRTKPEFKRFLSISRGSSFECVPIIEIAYNQHLIDEKRKDKWLGELLVIAKMLSKLKTSI
jgi:four helix bundle protein